MSHAFIVKKSPSHPAHCTMNPAPCTLSPIVFIIFYKKNEKLLDKACFLAYICDIKIISNNY